MNRSSEDQIQAFEERLKNAMLVSDVSELDSLLAPDLIFTNHLGQIMTKQDDLNAHQSGEMKIEKIEFSDQQIKIIDSVSIVTVQARILGNFGGVLSEGVLRFTRIWQKASNDSWQVIAAHSSVVT